jgi:fructose-1,6-bisphosphatase/inositol monophosphatase family enzyme
MTDFTPHFSQAVATLMRTVSNEVILPRYRNLAAHEVMEKAADDLVTIADRESEERLSAGLAQLLPEARIVGEEACATDPALLDGLGEGLCWIIDPIDGTGNFAAGRPPFGVMVALVDNGETLGGWIYDPLEGRHCEAIKGRGAQIDGQTIHARTSGEALPIAGISTLYAAPEERADLKRRAQGRLNMVPIPRCAAEQYPRIVLGINDISLFNRTLPWDHAAGVLFINEAGGCCTRFDGSPYRVGTNERGLLAAASHQMWEQAADILLR